MGGRNPITNRFIRHFNIIYVEPYDMNSLNSIFSNIMNWIFSINVNPVLPRNLETIGSYMITATI